MGLTAEQKERIRPAMERLEFWDTVGVWNATQEQLNQVLEMRKEIGIPFTGKPCGPCAPDIFRELYKHYKND